MKIKQNYYEPSRYAEVWFYIDDIEIKDKNKLDSLIKMQSVSSEIQDLPHAATNLELFFSKSAFEKKNRDLYSLTGFFAVNANLLKELDPNFSSNINNLRFVVKTVINEYKDDLINWKINVTDNALDASDIKNNIQFNFEDIYDGGTADLFFVFNK